LVFLDLALGQERHGNLPISHVKHVLNQIDAAVMPLQVVESKQELNLIVFQNGQREGIFLSQDLHLSRVDSSEDLTRADTHGHSGEALIYQACQTDSLGQPPTYDGALSPTVDEGLNIMAIELAVDVKHGDLTEKLWEILLDHIVLFIYHILTYVFFDLFLGLNIVRVSVHEPIHLFHLLLLSVHLVFESSANNLSQLNIIISRDGITQLWVLVKDVVKLVGVAQVVSFQTGCLLVDALSGLALENLVKEVLTS
jgi:hypothetical protein